jgi:cell division septum initiation protein DivIVA
MFAFLTIFAFLVGAFYQNKFKTELARAKAYHYAVVDQIKALYKKELEDVKNNLISQHQAKIVDIHTRDQNKHIQLVETMTKHKDKYLIELAQAKAEHQIELAQVKADYQIELTQLKAEHQSELTQLKAQYQAELERIKANPT